jgi:hypothetical protein
MRQIRSRTTLLLGITVAAMLAAPSLAAAAPPPAGDVTVTTSHVYLHDEASEPWGEETNDEAMTQVFGDSWEEEYFQTVNTSTEAGGLFASSVRFIYLDGGDSGADELEAFLAAHEAALKAFTDRGGRLFLNAAPNEGDGMSYDGRQIVYGSGSEATETAHAADPSHPIFTGPYTPVATTYTGNSFGHALVTGPGLTSLIVGDDEDVQGAIGAAAADPTRIVLAEYRSCTGMTLIGGMTTHNFHDPEAEAANLRANIISYAANATIDSCAPTSASSGCVSATEVGVTVTDQPGGSGPASVRYTVDGGAEQSVATDASGNARIVVAAGEHTVAFRGVDGAGNVQANPSSVTVTCQAEVAQTQEPDRTRPRAGIAGVRDECVRGTFRVRVTARDDVALQRIGVRRDGRRVLQRTLRGVRRTSFTVRINAAPLRSGGHRIVVTVRDAAGNRRTVNASFVRCARPTQAVSPDLTG